MKAQMKLKQTILPEMRPNSIQNHSKRKWDWIGSAGQVKQSHDGKHAIQKLVLAALFKTIPMQDWKNHVEEKVEFEDIVGADENWNHHPQAGMAQNDLVALGYIWHEWNQGETAEVYDTLDFI